MSKTPYEIRLELLKMAQDQVTQRYYQKMDNIRHNETMGRSLPPLNEVPEFPSTQEVLVEAEILKTFVDKQ